MGVLQRRSRPLVSFPAAEKTAVIEHILRQRVQRPIVPLPGIAGLARDFYETVVKAQVVPDGVLPRGELLAVIWKSGHDELADAAQRQLLVRRLQDRHRYQSDVGVRRFDELGRRLRLRLLGGARLAVAGAGRVVALRVAGRRRHVGRVLVHGHVGVVGRVVVARVVVALVAQVVRQVEARRRAQVQRQVALEDHVAVPAQVAVFHGTVTCQRCVRARGAAPTAAGPGATEAGRLAPPRGGSPAPRVYVSVNTTIVVIITAGRSFVHEFQAVD